MNATIDAGLKNRLNRIAVSLYFFIPGFVFGSWAGRIVFFKEKFNLSEEQLGFLLLALPVGSLSGLPFSGWAVKKFGSKKMITFASFGYPLMLLFIGFSQSVSMLATSLVIFGFMGNITNISNNTQAVGVENNYGRSIMSSFHGVWSLAGFASAGVSFLMVSLGFEPKIHFIIVAILVWGIMLYYNKNLLEQDINNFDSSEASEINKKKTGSLFTNKNIIVLGLIAFGCMCCEGTMFEWSAIYFKTIVQVPENLAIIGYASFMCTMAIGRFISDGIITKYGKKTVMRICGLLVAFGLTIAVSFPYFPTAMLGFFFVGFGVSSVVPTVYSIAGKTKNVNASIAMAAVSSIGFLGFVLGPPIIGFIAEASSLRWSFATIGLLGIMTSFLSQKIESNN